MEVRVLSWNLFHGRDHPPQSTLLTWRSRLLRLTERGATHAQVNRDLFDEFAWVIADADWDIAMLQECPPRWAEDLANRTQAEPHLVLTARNLPPLFTRAQRIAGRINPDLIASWEGGSNVTLVRARAREDAAPVIVERLDRTLTRNPETRRMAFTRLDPGLCVANLHAGTSRHAAESEVLDAARRAVEWAGDESLIFGGDLNLRPATSGALFEQLETELGLVGTTGPGSIDHILSRGLEVTAPARAWLPEEREVPDANVTQGGRSLAIRLSDHAPVSAAFEL